MTRSELERERIALGKRAQKELSKDVDQFRDTLYSSILDIIVGLSVSDQGLIKFSSGNIRTGARVANLVEKRTNAFNKTFVQKIIRKTLEILNLNKKYIKSFEKLDSRVERRIKEQILLKLGYDSAKKALLSGGWLGSISGSASIGISTRVAGDMQRALSGGISLKGFLKEFKEAFTGPGLGYPEHHYKTFVFDLFQSIDREVQKEYADRLGLDYFLYSGTVKDNTRPFCKARAGKYYSREEVESWKDLDFQGKLKVGYNPFTHCGGHNCRHHLSAISEEVLIALGKIDEVDTFNR